MDIGSTAEKITGLLNACWRWRSYATILASWALIAYLMVDNKALSIEGQAEQKRLLERIIDEKQKSIDLLLENKEYVEAENDRLRRNQTNDNR